MKTIFALMLLLKVGVLSAQQSTISVADNLVTENIPALPPSYVADVKSYTESRGASLVATHPLRK